MPAELTSLGEKHLVALADRLSIIREGEPIVSGASKVYRTSPSLITLSPLAIGVYNQPLQPVSPPVTQLDLGPVLGISRSSGSSLLRVTLRPRGGPDPLKAYERQDRVTIVGYVKGTDALPAWRVLERLYEDVVECMLAEPTLGDLVQKLETSEDRLTDRGQFEPANMAQFEQDLIITARAA